MKLTECLRANGWMGRGEGGAEVWGETGGGSLESFSSQWEWHEKSWPSIICAHTHTCTHKHTHTHTIHLCITFMSLLRYRFPALTLNTTNWAQTPSVLPEPAIKCNTFWIHSGCICFRRFAQECFRFCQISAAAQDTSSSLGSRGCVWLMSSMIAVPCNEFEGGHC